MLDVFSYVAVNIWWEDCCIKKKSFRSLALVYFCPPLIFHHEIALGLLWQLLEDPQRVILVEVGYFLTCAVIASLIWKRNLGSGDSLECCGWPAIFWLMLIIAFLYEGPHVLKTDINIPIRSSKSNLDYECSRAKFADKNRLIRHTESEFKTDSNYWDQY